MKKNQSRATEKHQVAHESSILTLGFQPTAHLFFIGIYSVLDH
jgi:hypothetical protein